MTTKQLVLVLSAIVIRVSSLLAGDAVSLLEQSASAVEAPAFVLEMGDELVLVDIAEEGRNESRNDCPDTGWVDVFTSLNVRTAPGIENTRIGGLGPGTKLDIVAEKDGWYQIRYNGSTAWVCGHYVYTKGEELRNEALASTVGLERSSPPAGEPVSPGQRNPQGGLDVPLYCQSRIGATYPHGFCGPTSIKMALEYLGIRKDINFLGLEDVGGATPVYTPGNGAGHQAMLDMVRHCGASGSYMTHSKSIAWLKEQTEAGHPVVVSVRGNYGPRSTQGHILVVTGVTADGRHVIINDSADGKRHLCPASTFYNAWSSSSRMGIVVTR